MMRSYFIAALYIYTLPRYIDTFMKCSLLNSVPSSTSDQLDAAKRCAQLDKIAAFEGRLDDYNAMLLKPGELSLKM